LDRKDKQKQSFSTFFGGSLAAVTKALQDCDVRGAGGVWIAPELYDLPGAVF
jgi:hypothetical protein